MSRRTILVALTIATFVACQKQPEAPATTTAATETAPAAPQPAEISEGLQTPESVLYDADQDVYFISNINGSPVDFVDDNGYISRVNAETLQVETKWIDGAKADVQLSAPKGMAIVGEELWVTDGTYIRKFDRKTGAPKVGFAVEGTTFLNDLASDGTTVYVSDTGVKAGAGGNFEPTGSDAIWMLKGVKSTRYATGKDLNGPNGLAVVGGKVWVVSFRGNELYDIEKGKKANVVTLPKGGLDGLVALPDGSLAVSSWDAKAIYRGSEKGPFQAIVENIDSPADIGYDSKRHRLLVPHFMENKVTFHEVQ